MSVVITTRDYLVVFVAIHCPSPRVVLVLKSMEVAMILLQFMCECVGLSHICFVALCLFVVISSECVASSMQNSSITWKY